uniref:hypothetical protein n=1 Tax=Microbacterium proteolyticum TaxID=1572644 RepID=UPI002416F1D3|nr:hypothetical protein [Microbacterium proteolyticum]
MTEATQSKLVNSWPDPSADEDDEGSWPPPDRYSDYLITGHLADLIRARTGESGAVHFIERETEVGYSEWTSESDYEVTIQVGSFRRKFDGSADTEYLYQSALPKIQKWLDGDES